MSSTGYPSQVPALGELLAQLKLGEQEDKENSVMERDLLGIEKSPYSLKNFEAFLLRSHCSENFEFWKHCNDYLVNHNKSNFSYKEWNKKLYKDFIEENSSMECNLPDRIKKLFTRWYNEGSTPDEDTVLKAKQHALDLMSDAYRHFIRFTNTSNSAASTSTSLSTTSITCASVVLSDSKLAINTTDSAQDSSRGINFNDDTELENSKRKIKLKSSLKKNVRKSAENLAKLTSSSSDESTQSAYSKDIFRSNSTSSHKFLDKGLALVTKLKGKKLRPKLNSFSLSNSNIPTISKHKISEEDYTSTDS